MIEGGLYTRDYLERGICEEPEWLALAEGAVEALRAELSAVFSVFPLAGKPVEGVT